MTGQQNQEHPGWKLGSAPDWVCGHRTTFWRCEAPAQNLQRLMLTKLWLWVNAVNKEATNKTYVPLSLKGRAMHTWILNTHITYSLGHTEKCIVR